MSNTAVNLQLVAGAIIAELLENKKDTHFSVDEHNGKWNKVNSGM